MSRFIRLLAPLLLIFLTSSVRAQDLEKKVRTVLETHCYRCHSHQSGKSRGELMLDSRALMLKGGQTGPAIVIGQPDKSLLIKAIRHEDENLKMPEKGKLSPGEIDLLAAWVRDGAPWTESAVKTGIRAPGKITEADRKYWAFQPIKSREPAGNEANPIDRFILARLQREGLGFSPAAEPRSLVRRLYFDLIGLPPTPEQIDEFLAENSNSPNAVARLVDRLLASPHYGERWARHWLDVVRFAESDGYRLDSFRPLAYRYRDYVIKSFQDDKPFDQFVREQIAGDELYPEQPDALVAIGFLTHGIYEFNQRNVRGQWHEILSEITDVTGEVFLGLSVGCARCHDHKFDPILQTDYYALRSFFEGLLPSTERPYATAEKQAEYNRKLSEWRNKTADIRRQIEAIEEPVRAKIAATMTVKFPKDIQEMLAKPLAERSALEKQLAALAYRQIAMEHERLDARISGKEKDQLLQLRKELAKFEADKPAPLPQCQAIREVGVQAPATNIPKKPSANAIEPGFLTVLNQPAPAIKTSSHHESSGRRSALAEWLTKRDNPLTARVIVNRIWQQHFGRGLVATANDFGNLGERPSHPELLDYLADRFVKEGWSLKKLQRLIVTSRTYQQAAILPAESENLKRDPDNRLFSRMATRRLDAEQIRDAMLLITGKLDRRVGGPSVEFKEPRRSVYLKVMRNAKESLLEVFDVPDAFTSAAQRNVTTTSTQALLLLNSPMMLQRGSYFADLLHNKSLTPNPSPGVPGEGREWSDEQKIERAFNLAFGRPPSSKERVLAHGFLAEQSKRIVIPSEKTPGYEVGKIPFHDGKAAVITPGSNQVRFQVPQSAKLPTSQFTLEAFVLLRSVFEDAADRTIAGHWAGDTQGPGWTLGVTGKKAAFKAQSLVLHLFGQDRTGKPAGDAIYSGLALQLNRPYYVAVSVNLADASDKGVTFHLKDLANDEEPLLSYSTAHKVPVMSPIRGHFTIGGTAGKLERTWDGLIDDVRLSNTVLSAKQLLLTSDAVTRSTVGFWQFEKTPGMLQDSSPNRLTLQRLGAGGAAAFTLPADPRRAAWSDFCQVLLNANEFLYVD